MTAPVLRRRRCRKYWQVRQVDTTQADGGQGTGLGLAIAKGIMEAHGGSIVAQSPQANGRGTRIALEFPRQDVPV